MATNNTKDFHAYQYANRLVRDKEKWMPDFQLRARLYGDEWRDMIWGLCKRISKREI